MHMEYSLEHKNISLAISAANAGKFRFKKRNTRYDFGESFSTRECCFDEKTYLEWQIGYDVPVKDVRDGNAETNLNTKSFVGSNGKQKYPYELSEIFFSAMQLGLIDKEETKHLLKEISEYKNFIDKKVISVERYSKLAINGINFEETSIKLPTLFMVETPDGAQIEISIQKQQYATGVQPMIYLSIPFKSFMDHAYLLGKSSVVGDNLTYIIDKSNIQNIINLMKVFGMASKRHNHDIVQIIQTLLEII